MTDPQSAFGDLIAIAHEGGTILPTGSIVSAGTVSKPFTLSGAAEVNASFLGQALGFRTELHHGTAATGRGDTRPWTSNTGSHPDDCSTSPL